MESVVSGLYVPNRARDRRIAGRTGLPPDSCVTVVFNHELYNIIDDAARYNET